MRINIIKTRLDTPLGSPAMLEVRDAHAHRADASPSQGMRRETAQCTEHDSRRLLQGQREVVIRHGGECYRLRHTRNDKLILTK
jgi:hemin uptake protein HemP